MERFKDQGAFTVSPFFAFICLDLERSLLTKIKYFSFSE
jgi:hypothetical protein